MLVLFCTSMAVLGLTVTLKTWDNAKLRRLLASPLDSEGDELMADEPIDPNGIMAPEAG